MRADQTTRVEFASALSTLTDVESAAAQACDACGAALGGAPDLVLCFVSRHHAARAAVARDQVARRLSPGTLLGATAEAVIADAPSETGPGVSVLAARLPDARFTPFDSDQFPDLMESEPLPHETEALARVIGAGPDLRAVIVLADPFSTPTLRLVPALNTVLSASGDPQRRPFLIGGMASAARQAGGNTLFVDGRVRSSGLVGVALHGGVRVDAVVSQGCRPIGETYVVTKCRHNLVLELGGRPALDVMNEVIASLPEHDRSLASGGVFMGRVVNEYKERFGRGDFLIRAVTGLEPGSRGVAVADLIRRGTTVRFHLRDPRSASEDLSLLLDGQKLDGRPAGALLFSCTARGQRFFGTPDHDAKNVLRAFRPLTGGESLAKPGSPEGPSEDIPLAGFFAAGEIGPVGAGSYVHGLTASVAIFRPL